MIPQHESMWNIIAIVAYLDEQIMYTYFFFTAINSYKKN